jgi:hypothetical protein
MGREDHKSAKEQNSPDVSRVSEERMGEFREVFQKLGLPQNGTYPGIQEFSKGLRRTTVLRYEGIVFSVTNSSSSSRIS